MDKDKTKKKTSFFEEIRAEFRNGAEKRKRDKGALFVDIGVFLAAFFFARTHILFGSHPLAAAFIAVLPSRVWIGLIGAVAGSLSLGRTGVIHAIIALVILFLRIIISGGGGIRTEKERSSLFAEPLIMRLAAATVGAFIGAGYEMLLSSFSFTSALFGVFGVGLTLGFAFMFSGLFFTDVSVRDFLFGNRDVLNSGKGRDGWGLVFFQGSLAVTSFLFAYSLEAYTYFGISFSYIYVFLVTLFIAKRFGAVRAMAIGFISSVGISPPLSVAFALAGVGSGLLFNFGAGYALVGAGILAVGWSGYIEGMSGFLSLFPEYMISAIITAPLIRKLPKEMVNKSENLDTGSAEDMVDSFLLKERKKGSSISALEDSLYAAADKIRSFRTGDSSGDFEEYRSLTRTAFFDIGITPCEEIINKISTKVYKKHKISPEDAEPEVSSDKFSEVISRLGEAVGDYEHNLYRSRRTEALADEYELISKMINESLTKERCERAEDAVMTAAAREAFVAAGFPEGDIRVIGERRKCVVGAGIDPDGRLITSSELKGSLESALGLRLGGYEYYRRGDMALFSCAASPTLSAISASAGIGASENEQSGDSTRVFESGDMLYALISDGMGKGREAKESSDFVTEYLSQMLLSDAEIATSMSALNHIIRHKGKECSATLDLLRLDLIAGDALFVKSGAAPSYVKRDKSIYRIQSKTAPVGLVHSVDAEKIRVEIKSGDYIIMLSDGVSAAAEDSPWLLSYLSKEPPTDTERYANEILSLARENSHSRDDMTVLVIKVVAAKKE